MSVIAIHLGAGPRLSTGRQVIFQKLCKTACRSALKVIRAGGSAVDAVCEAIRILEDSTYTNAGSGSNLTICGKVECDASVMDGKTSNFGAVGALSDICNPILVAKALLIEQDKGLLPLGRIPPCMLVSEGAKQWALEQGFCELEQNKLITERAQQIHQKNKITLENYVSAKKRKLNDKNLQLSPVATNFDVTTANTCLNSSENVVTTGTYQGTSLDTIGAVCIDSSGNVASACSSGGIVLKHSGRIGQAAIFAAGCWAENGDITKVILAKNSDFTKPNPSVATVTTGVGENLIKTMFAQKCANCIKQTHDIHGSLKNLFDMEFLKSKVLKENEERLAGTLILCHDGEAIDVMVGHTTSTMCFAYADLKSSKVDVVFSQLPPGAQPGMSVQIQGVMIKT